MSKLNLPEDFVIFLKSNKQLKYDPEQCEAGRITLLKLNQLSITEIFIDSVESPLAKTDPNSGKKGYYSVPAINLIADCEGYDPEGILIWLPELELFGTWDNDHWDILVFPNLDKPEPKRD